MNKVLSLALSFALVCPQTLMAQSEPYGPQLPKSQAKTTNLDLQDQVVNMVIYSSEHNKALVGLLAPDGRVHLEECAVPAVAIGQIVSLKMFQSCAPVADSSFLGDIKTVETINSHFAKTVEESYLAIQTHTLASKAEDVRIARDRYIQPLALVGAVGFGMAVAGYFNLFNSSQAPLSLAARTRYLGLGIIGAAVTTASVLAIAWAEGELEDYEVQPLEATVVTNLKAFAVDKGLSEQDAVKDLKTEDFYPAVKQGLLKLIATVNKPQET